MVELQPHQRYYDTRDRFFAAVDDADWWLEKHSVGLWENDRCIGMLGINPLADGIGEAWAYLSAELIRKHPIALTRTARRVLEERLGTQYWRIQAAIDCRHVRSVRWASAMGMKVEGVLQQFLGRHDHIMMARVL